MGISPAPSIYSTRTAPFYQHPPFSCSDPTLQAQSKQRRRLHFKDLNPKNLLKKTPKQATFTDITRTEIEQLIPFLVEDLERPSTKGPTQDQRERLLKKLPERLQASRWQPHMKGCAVHSKLSSEVLYGLDNVLKGIATDPPPPLHLTENRYFEAFFAMEAVWSEDLDEICGETLVDCRLYQENECSGCRVTRILSDGALLDALLVAAGVSEVIDGLLSIWLEKAWEELMLKVPEQVGGRGAQRRKERVFEVEMLKKRLEMMEWEETDPGDDLEG